MSSENYHVHKIQDDLSQRQKMNPLYSLRAYARDLGLHPATLSQVLKGTRPLPLKDSLRVAEALRLSAVERTLFMESFYRSKVSIDNIKISSIDERYILDESNYKILAEWEHFAVLTAFDLEDFVCNAETVSELFGITKNRAKVVIDNLVTSGLLISNPGEVYFTRTRTSVRTTEDTPNQALKDGHKEVLDMGKLKIDTTDVMLRDFSAMTIALDMEKLTEAKTIIREFRRKMTALLREGSRTEVYQLAIQFYPLTQTEKESEV
ncbi:MAG: TIGR02147 family protein [Bdellovibrionales bacterium]|nr:TIGR02147 family protein [Bdellovibrionales bacterium]